MENKTDDYKPRLQEYLHKKGVYFEGDKIRCISPTHEDRHPSAAIGTKNNRLICHACGFTEDIFGCAGVLIGHPGNDKTAFIEQLKEVKRELDGITAAPIPEPKKKQDKIVVVPLEKQKALEVFSEKRIFELAERVINKNRKKPVKITIPDDGWFAFYNEEEKIDLISIRFTTGDKKTVLSFYWNGRAVAMRGYPNLLFNRHILAKSTKPVIIHEGEKLINHCEVELQEFSHTAWNGGGKKYKDVDFSVLKNAPAVYLLPDDDQKIDKRTGELLPPNEQPGLKTMIGLRELLREKYGIASVIIPFLKAARKIKPDGADIEEILQVITPEKFTELVLKLKVKAGEDERKNNTDNRKSGDTSGKSKNNNIQSGSNSQESKKSIKTTDKNSGDHLPTSGRANDLPFKILGIAADKRAYFLTYENRLIDHDLSSLTEKKLIEIGGLQHFRNIYSGTIKRDDWLSEIDQIMHLSSALDFNIDDIRGRGAWKSKQGICYHDGKETMGKPDTTWTFIRKPQKKIGLGSDHCAPAVRSEIMRLSKTFSFATSKDATRLLSWACLAPFAGALDWRPAFLATGESGTGKSTVIEKIINPLSAALFVNGASTTEAGIRQYNGNDSGGIIIDEAESRKQNDKERIENIFSLMRASTTDDSPLTLKGSSGGTAMSFSMRSMFGFIAINAAVDNVADDNRIIRINFKRADNFSDYVVNMTKTEDLLTRENCDGIRAFTWDNLDKIIRLSNRLKPIIQITTKQDARFAAGESILLAANMIVWENLTYEIGDEDLTQYVTEFYHGQTHEEKRDETEEMITRLLDEVIIIGEKNKESLSLREILISMKKYQDYEHYTKTGQWDKRKKDPHLIGHDIHGLYKRSVEQRGVSVHGPTRELFIANNHHFVMKILEIGKGYHRQLERHDGVLGKSVSARVDSASKRGTIIKGFLEYE